MTNVDTVDTSKLWDMIKDIKYGMFTARHGNGHLHSRPMTTLNGSRDRGAVLWFFMSRSSDPVADLVAAPEVNVAYADPGNDAYVSVSGKAGVIEDVGRKRELWSALAQAWYAGGPEDPDLALVAVAITHAEYWDMKTNKAEQLFKIARAALTGAPPTDLGEHGRVRMG
jgi:general stress protein 26